MRRARICIAILLTAAIMAGCAPDPLAESVHVGRGVAGGSGGKAGALARVAAASLASGDLATAAGLYRQAHKLDTKNVEHLIGLGHNAVAQLRGPIDVDLIENRTAGFRQSVAGTSAVDVTISDVARELTVPEGRRLMRLTLDQNQARPPTAVFAHNDLMAIGAIEELSARGLRCPDDVSVVGYNDAPLVEHLEPPLSTIRIPGEEIGRRAGEMVIELIDDPGSPPESVSIPASLIPRGSTAPPSTATA